MKERFEPADWKDVRFYFAVTVLLSIALGLTRYAMNTRGSMLEHIVASNIIGLAICSACLGLGRLARTPRQLIVALFVAVPLGFWIGRTLSLAYLGFTPISIPRAAAEYYVRMPQSSMTMTITGLIAGAIVTVLFYMRGRHQYMLRQLELERLRVAASEGERHKAELQRLQAQIEPHFLFNTLATLDGLIAAEPQQARTLLSQFTDYLRATLQRTREDGGTLADEIGVIRGYLAIMQTRLGARLQFEIEVPDDLLRLPFPPMLLQPLVENAISHGIEASESGGRIVVSACREDSRLQTEVSDTGVGLERAPASKGHGVGLQNVRERLRLLFGDGASLNLYANEPSGVTARITMPCQAQ